MSSRHWSILVLVNVLRVSSRTRQGSELNHTQRYLEIFRHFLKSPISYCWRRPTGPGSARTTNRQEAWKWLYPQVREKIYHADWQQMEFIDNVRNATMAVFREVAHCEDPPHRPPQIAGELVQMHNVVVSRCVGRHNWTLNLPSYSEQTCNIIIAPCFAI